MSMPNIINVKIGGEHHSEHCCLLPTALSELLKFAVTEDLSEEDVNDIVEHILVRTEQSGGKSLDTDVVDEIEQACKATWEKESEEGNESDLVEDKDNDGRMIVDKDTNSSPLYIKQQSLCDQLI